MIENNIVSIGGVGGSGTRIISEILQKAGYFTGYDINESKDNLLFTLLFKRQNILTLSEDEFDDTVNIFVKIMSSVEILSEDELSFLSMLASKDRTLHSSTWLKERLSYVDKRENHSSWGWKEPNTHIIIEKLFQQMDGLKFVYVYRNGLDMAYSQNQNQLKLWGGIFLNNYKLEINPKNSLKYWCITHKRMLKLKKKFKSRVFMLDFDKFCLQTEDVLREFCEFIEYKGDISKFSELVIPPSSIGRHKRYSLECFDVDDIEFVKSIYAL